MPFTLLQNNAWYTTFQMERSLFHIYCLVNETTSIWKSLHLKMFQTRAEDNLQMAFCFKTCIWSTYVELCTLSWLGKKLYLKCLVTLKLALLGVQNGPYE